MAAKAAHGTTTMHDEEYRVDLPGPFRPSIYGDVESEEAVCTPIENLGRALQEHDLVHAWLDGKDIVSRVSRLPADEVEILGLVIGRIQAFKT
jgi:hypothetical protein